MATELTVDIIFKMFAETAKQSRANDKMLTKKFKELAKKTDETGELIKELTKKTDAQIEETGKQIKELTKKTDAQIEKTDAQIEETGKQIKELTEKTSKQIKELNKYTDGVGRSNGDFAEDFFYRSLSKNFKLNGINYNYVDRNLTRHIKKLKLKREYDIILVNDTVLTVVEVKYKLKTVDIDKFKEQLRDFRLLFPEYSSFKLFGCLAAMSISDRRLQEAESFGIFVLSQKGEDIELINSKNFKAKLF